MDAMKSFEPKNKSENESMNENVNPKKNDEKQMIWKFFRCVCKPQNAKFHPRMRN
jgi:hypothetical protein